MGNTKIFQRFKGQANSLFIEPVLYCPPPREKRAHIYIFSHIQLT